MPSLPTLYSRTSLGQLAQWTIEYSGPRFRTHEGIVDGVITTSEWTTCKGKNTGRANATAPTEQATKEAAAKHRKKCEAGYTEDAGAVDTSVQHFEPMLAHKWTDYGEDLDYPLYTSPKMDGLRSIVRLNGMWSRNGKPIKSAPHIHEALLPLLRANPTLVLDGELYADQLAHDFNRLMSLAKTTKPTPEDLAASRAELEYWIFDCDNGMGEPYIARLAQIRGVVAETGVSFIRVVSTTLVATPAELDTLYEQYLSAGYEGQMVRAPSSVYEHKRSHFLLKRKEMQDGEYVLVDLEEGRGNRAGIASRAICRLPDGRTFEAGMIGSFEYCADLLEHKDEYIGKLATIQYQNLTPGPDGGVPRFGKMKAIRDVGL